MEKLAKLLINAFFIIVLGSVALFGGKAHAQSCPAVVSQYIKIQTDNGNPNAEQVVINAYNINNALAPSESKEWCRQNLEIAFIQNFNRPINQPKAAPARPATFGEYTGIDSVLQKYSPQVAPIAPSAPRGTTCNRNGSTTQCYNW